MGRRGDAVALVLRRPLAAMSSVITLSDGTRSGRFFGRILGGQQQMERFEAAQRLGNKKVCEAVAVCSSTGSGTGTLGV